MLDFYCAKARLAVEVDSMSHDVGDRPERDILRDVWLKAHGVTVMRIAAADVIRAVDETVDGIVRAASAVIGAKPPEPPPPRFARSPSPAERGRISPRKPGGFT